MTVAVVTGGNRGIGYEICKGLAREGVRVVLCSRDAAAGEKAAAAVARDGGALESRPLDVNDEASVAALARWLEERHGRIDILVNNAAVLEDRDRVTGPLELDVGVLARMLDTNVCGQLRVVKALVPLLRRGSDARIVNLSSALAQTGFPGTDRPAYRLSKLALNGLTRMLAAALEKDGIKVNSVSPGWARTRMGGDEAPRSAAEGADTVVWLALRKDCPSGGFFMDRKPIPF